MWLNQRTVDAIRIMAALADTNAGPVTAAKLAAITAITPRNVQKTANILVQAGFILATRGRHGGLRIARPATTILVSEIARAFEPADCPVSFLPTSAPDDRLSHLIFSAHRAFFRSLETMALADLVAPRAP